MMMVHVMVATKHFAIAYPQAVDGVNNGNRHHRRHVATSPRFDGQTVVVAGRPDEGILSLNLEKSGG
jgi:hypothetical protein